MKQVILDCDNTFGVPGCDVDDGLALLYLLGCPDVELLGVTLTYGNSTLDVVSAATEKLLTDIGRTDIPVAAGGAAPGAYENAAGKYLADQADARPGELSVLATGSLTNLCAAYRYDPEFFEKVREIVLMGGVTEPLIFEKKPMDELNFSCDPQATYTVLSKGRNVSVITGNNCTKVLFTRKEYDRVLTGTDRWMGQYIRRETDYWFGYNEDGYGIPGFYNWDVTAAVYLTHPELFEDRLRPIALSAEALQHGSLPEKSGGRMLNLPEIREEEPFKRTIYEAWLRGE